VAGYVSDSPQLGYYGSARGGTIDAHLRLLDDIGVDFLVLNLHMDETGVNQTEWATLGLIFDRAAALDSKVQLAVQLVPYTDDFGLIDRTVAQVAELYAGQREYLRVDSKPALFWFWSGALDGHPGLEALRGATAGFTNIATSLRMPTASEAQLTGGLFEGFAPFSPLELAAPDKREAVWSLAYRTAIDAGMRHKVATVSPGYDDSGLLDRRRLGNPYRVVDRNDGETYRRSLAWAEGLNPRPDIVLLSTFNEFHENTHIEPSIRLGSIYADLTRDFTRRLRANEASHG
jgi:hypothetical protein